jgi:AcrR family transcriptional regulator
LSSEQKDAQISEEQRQVRRDQILAATWRCFFRRGIHATSMVEIIHEAELSAGAVYLYYKSKDDLIVAAISAYMGSLRALLLPLLAKEVALPPLTLVQQITSAIAGFTTRGGVDLNAVILMCWTEAQTNKEVKALVSGFQLKYRTGLTHIAKQWLERGDLKSQAKPDDIAKALLSFFLGFIVQSALLGPVEPKTIMRGMKGLLNGFDSIDGYASA